MKKKTIGLVTSCLIVAALLLTSCAPAVEELPVVPEDVVVEEEVVEEEVAPISETVAFPDEKLGATIRDALGKPPGEDITAAELAELISLDASDMGIADLSGIEYCVNLAELDLQENYLIADISPLASLTSLTKLKLGGRDSILIKDV